MRLTPSVSIHAPARGATPRAASLWERTGVSIHAPARGATCGKLRQMAVMSSFNPRARKGRDLITDKTMVVLDVSIHAPARGATMISIAVDNDALFQSTRPQGARLETAVLWVAGSSFNPRARKGRDKVAPSDDSRSDVSIHAPARGATCSGLTITSRIRFNPRARKGRDV